MAIDNRSGVKRLPRSSAWKDDQEAVKTLPIIRENIARPALVPVKQEAIPGSREAIGDYIKDYQQKREQEAAAIEATTPVYDPEEADFETWRRKQGMTKERKPGFGNTIKDFLKSGMRRVEMMREEAAANRQLLDLGSITGAFLGGGVRERFDRERSQRQEWQLKRKPEFERKEALREGMQKRQEATALQAFEGEKQGWARSNQSLRSKMDQLKADMLEFKKGNLPIEAILKQLESIGKISNAAEGMDLRTLDSESRRKLNDIRGKTSQQQVNIRAQDSASRRGLNTATGQYRQKQGALTDARIKKILSDLEDED